MSRTRVVPASVPSLFQSSTPVAGALALKYIVSTAGTSFPTLRAAVDELDRLAELKRTDAILCDAANLRISDRLLARFGWESHKPERWRRAAISWSA